MNNIVSFFRAFSHSKPERFEERLAQHLESLYQQAYQYTGNTHDAEDLLQDLLLELYGKQESVMAVKNLPAWLSRCLYNRFVDRYRKYRRQPEQQDVHNEALQGELAHPGMQERDYFHRQLLRHLERLSLEQRSVISLHDLSGYSLAEISLIMDAPVGTLKSHLHRGRKKLKEALNLQPDAHFQRL
ncbi:RNA polymerase sigma factor [Pseudomaricurvus alkylphenolicus]|jgi:RNA polymerase sigma-70 factor (ECF subfamily)|uniref:RNA polymerase sigma factor n=1 Tax=Pseudomaricurvus alkylphenolicus TaxID=1306991 RepID=UPI00141F7CBB|nr:RNA polymerase sigma factor [Pseudomaricurvus alkylphenolicus]NIB38568.1 RNA polymerase sigma factor [Pseudomaricurvus alkylphenolicus]